jgi:hypothetical protein
MSEPHQKYKHISFPLESVCGVRLVAVGSRQKIGENLNKHQVFELILTAIKVIILIIEVAVLMR